MKTELSHIYESVDLKGNTTQLKITVDYDTVERSWVLVKILAIDCKTRTAVDLTHIFFDCFHDQAEAIVEGISWREKLSDQPKTIWNNRIHPTIEATIAPFFK